MTYLFVPDNVVFCLTSGGEAAMALASATAGITFLADVVLAEDGAPGGKGVSGVRGASSGASVMSAVAVRV